MNSKKLMVIVTILVMAILAVIGFKLRSAGASVADLTLPASACNPGLSVCSAVSSEGWKLEFSISPQPIRALQTLNLDIKLGPLDVERIEIDFEGSQMEMGINRTRLSGSHSHFTGQTMLPICITGRMEWVATILVTTPQRKIAIPFYFFVDGR